MQRRTEREKGNLFANHSSLIIIIIRGKKAVEFIRDPLQIPPEKFREGEKEAFPAGDSAEERLTHGPTDRTYGMGQQQPPTVREHVYEIQGKNRFT